MSDVLPLLAVIRAPVRGLAATLPQVVSEPATSPWSPKTEPVAPPSPVDVDAIREEARREGRAEGLRETEALRARLSQVIAALEEAQQLVVPATCERIADAAACAVDAWFAGADRRELFTPIIAGWLAGAGSTDASVRVHPGDVAAMTAAIDGAPLTVIADPALAPGEVRIRGDALELTHAFETRLPELRTAILAALEAP
jgi:flagellar biosynthesis/type III secretory pathway protein FliH